MSMKPLSLSKPVLSLFFLLLRKLAGRHHRGRMAAATKPRPPPPPLPGLDRLHGQTLVVDVEAWILRQPVRAFPYFMLVAVEAGGFLRGLLLLLLYPLLCLLGDDGARARAMATVALVGLEEEEVARVGRAVLPKFFLEDVTVEGWRLLRRRSPSSRWPRRSRGPWWRASSRSTSASMPSSGGRSPWQLAVTLVSWRRSTRAWRGLEPSSRKWRRRGAKVMELLWGCLVQSAGLCTAWSRAIAR